MFSWVFAFQLMIRVYHNEKDMSSKNSAFFDTVYLHTADGLVNMRKEINGTVMRFYGSVLL